MSRPLISVVVPVYNGEESIAACIESLLAMEYPKNKVEFLVVDNHSTDRTRAIIDQYPVIALSEPQRGPSAARNAGIRAARGEIIAFTDADCQVCSRWAHEIERTFDDAHIDAVMGFARGINANMFAELAQKRWEAFWLQPTATGYTLKRQGIDTRNCALRKRVLDTCGYFDPQLLQCEDLELSLRLNRARCRIVFNPVMEVSHRNPTSFQVSLAKGRERLAVVLQLMHDLPPDVREEELPFPSSALYGMAHWPLRGMALTGTLLVLRALRWVVLSSFRLCLALHLRHALTFKLYSVFFGLSYEIALLRIKREAQHP